MDIQCRHCNHQNPAGSLYCNKCSQDLNNGNPVNDEYISEKINQIIKKKCDEFKDEAVEVEFKTLASLEERATTWAKRQFAALTVAITVLISVLSYVGLSGLDFNQKYKELFEGAKKEIEIHKTSISTTASKFNIEADETYTKLKSLEEKFMKNSERLDDKMKIIEEFKSDEIKKYETKLKSALKKVDELRSDYKKLRNNRFKIQVHYRDNDQKIWHQNIDQLQNKLDNEGFILNKRHVSNVKAERQQIIIYSESNRKAAEAIRKHIADQFTFFEIRKEPSGFNEFDIIIKLCAQTGNLDNECNQPKKVKS